VEGIVVGDFQNNGLPDNGDLNGFHIQDPTGDANTATSDGIFIYYPSNAVDVSTGDWVRVRGTVSEYRADPNDVSSMTEITVSQLWVCSTGHTVAPTPISLPVASLDEVERYEGMLVTFPQTLVHLGVLQL
jgi:uncharacterized protein